MSDDSPILVLVRDLLFASRISSTAQALGASVQMLRDPAKLAGAAGQRLIVDLNLPGAIEAAGAWRSAGERQVIGFVSHVDTEAIASARSAGIDQVIARGRFVQILPRLLAD